MGLGWVEKGRGEGMEGKFIDLGSGGVLVGVLSNGWLSGWRGGWTSLNAGKKKEEGRPIG